MSDHWNVWHRSTYQVRTACHFARFTTDSDFFNHTFCTVYTIQSVCSSHTLSLCWCFTLVVNPLLTTIAHHIFSSDPAEPQYHAPAIASDDPICDRRYHAPAILLTLLRWINHIICNDRIAYMHASDRITCIDHIIGNDRIICMDHIAYMHASIASHVSITSYASIASHTCMYRSHHMTSIAWHVRLRYSLTPYGIENTGGHRCHGLHIRYQSDSTDIAANVASPRATAPRHSQYLLYSTLFLAPVHLSIGSSRSGGSERLASASTPSYLQRRYPLQERVSLARSTWSLQLNCISWSYTFVWDTLFPAR